MGTIYADFNQQGELLGFYDSSIHSVIPETAKIISNDLHREFLKLQWKVKISPETLELEEISKTQEEIDRENQLEINAEAQKFLLNTDWKVIRHRDQLDLGNETSLADEEFQELLQLRQQARNRVVKVTVS